MFRHADVVCLCLVYILHDLQFVTAGRVCKRRPYGICILQSLSHYCIISSHEQAVHDSYFSYFFGLILFFYFFFKNPTF